VADSVLTHVPSVANTPSSLHTKPFFGPRHTFAFTSNIHADNIFNFARADDVNTSNVLLPPRQSSLREPMSAVPVTGVWKRMMERDKFRENT
jgi:hypothetical protein